MQENTNENKVSRRQAINQTLLTSLAIAAGVVGVSTITNAQPSPKLELSVKALKRHSRKKTEKVVTPQESISFQNYQQSVEKLKQIKEQIYQINLSANGFLSSGINNSLSRIEQPTANSRTTIADVFFKNNVEVLLDQASNLLDRGLRDRAEWDNLSLSLFNLGLEIGQFLEYDDIHKHETLAGFYDQPVNDKTSILNVDKLAKDKTEFLYNLFHDMYLTRWNDNEMKDIASLHQQIAQQENEKNSQAGSIGSWTLTLEQYRLAIDFVYNRLQDESLATSLDQLKTKVDNDTSKLKWEIANRDFKMQRTEVERKYEYLKLLSLQAEDGILNYVKRLEPLKQRFQNDFTEALLRLEAAAQGMKEIYANYVPLPVKDDKPDYFDKCIVWTRNAINYIIKFARLDQSYVLPISIKDLYVKAYNNWEKAIEDGLMKFTLTVNNFPDTSFIRIKGISVFFQLSETNKHSCEYINYYNGSLMANITPPASSYYNHNGNSVTTNQAYVPSLRLNRLATRGFIRTPEVGGTSLYANLSPIGDWTIELPQIKNNKINTLFRIDDLILDLYITVNRAT